MGYNNTHSTFFPKEIICEKEKQNNVIVPNNMVILHNCHICFEEFEDLHLLELHIFLCHSSEKTRTAEASKKRVVEKNIFRPENSKKFHDELAKKDNSKKSDDDFSLDLKKKLPRRNNLENENEDEAARETPDEMDETDNCNFEEYLCDTCDKIFNEVSIFLTHCIKDHGFPTEEISYDCGNCYKSFANISLYRKHLIITERLKKKMKKHSKCKICGKSLKKNYLKIHISTVHEGARKFECKHCHSKFTQKASLTVHIKNSIKKLECKLCGKSYCSDYTLRMHMKVDHKHK